MPRRARRLSATARQQQLLDVAATLVLEAGASALTMERLAERAGVSKGLGYAYFRDAEEVALALWDREVAQVYGRVEQATAGTDSFDERLRRAVGAYFEVVTERGALLAGLQGVLSRARIERKSRGRLRAFLAFWSRQLEGVFPLQPRFATPTAGMMLAAADACARSWQAGRMHRAEAEALCVAFLLDGIRGSRPAALQDSGSRVGTAR